MAQFPKFGNIVTQLGLQVALIVIVYFVIATLLGLSLTYVLYKNDSIMTAVINIGRTKASSIWVELFFLSVALYIVGTITALTILKNSPDSEKIDKTNYIVILVIPLVVFLAVLFVKKSQPLWLSNTAVYIILISVFSGSAAGVLSLVETNLSKSKDISSKNALSKILIIFASAYVILRAILMAGSPIYGIESMIFLSLSVLFSFIATLPTYANLIVDHS